MAMSLLPYMPFVYALTFVLDELGNTSPLFEVRDTPMCIGDVGTKPVVVNDAHRTRLIGANGTTAGE